MGIAADGNCIDMPKKRNPIGYLWEDLEYMELSWWISTLHKDVAEILVFCLQSFSVFLKLYQE
jgi:hypothetical protein